MLERWTEAVGAGIARNAWPARIARDGTLHVSTADSVWAFELAHRAPEIAGRLGCFQRKVRFAPGPLPSRTEEPPPPPSARPPRSTCAKRRRSQPESTDENLRKSVQKAASFSLSRPSSDRPV